MIVGTLRAKEPYFDIHPKMRQAFQFLDDCLAHGAQPGRYELDGEDLYALVFRYAPQEKEDPRYEAHDRYLDIQCVTVGSEFHWYCPREHLTELTPYNPEKDIAFYSFTGSGSRLHLKAGGFAVYFPEDGHLPGMPDGTAEECMRVVVKIKC